MKTVLISLALFVCTSVHAIVSAPYSNSFQGSNGLIDRTDAVFITIKNRASQTIPIGAVVVPETTTYADGASATMSTSLVNSGLCVSTETIASGGVSHRCQVWGFFDGVLHGYNGSVAATAGFPMYMSTAYAGRVAYIVSPAATQDSIGMFLETTQASEGVKAFIKLL